MSEQCLIDTNVVLRHLVGDQPDHARAVAELFRASDRGDLILVLLPAVLCECVFVLQSFYELPRSRIADALRQFVQTYDIELTDCDIHLDALNRYAASKLHFVDCVLAAYAKTQARPLATFDAGIGKFGDVRILNPLTL